MDIAMHQDKGPVTLKEIGRRQNISAKYLDQIVSSLRNAGLIRTVRGAKGGLMLAKPPERITVLDIITLVEGRVALVDCVTEPEICERAPYCSTRDVWVRASQALEEVLAGVTVADLARTEEQRLKELGKV